LLTIRLADSLLFCIPGQKSRSAAMKLFSIQNDMCERHPYELKESLYLENGIPMSTASNFQRSSSHFNAQSNQTTYPKWDRICHRVISPRLHHKYESKLNHISQKPT
jgi:hypothetical protein